MDRPPEQDELQPDATASFSAFARAILAVMFVAGLGVALAIPLISSHESSEPSAAQPTQHRHRTHPVASTTTPSTTRSPSPSPSAELPRAVLGFSPDRFPKACGRSVARPSGSGEIVAYSRPTATVAGLDGNVVAQFRSDASLHWSASGKWLMSSAGHLWSASGKDEGHLFPQGAEKAAWMPASDCAFALSSDDQTLYVARPGHDAVEYATGPLQGFSISPDGSHLAVATFAGSEAARATVTVIGLTDRSAASYEAPEEDCCVVFSGAWLDEDSPLLWVVPGASAAADGWTLQAIDVRAHGKATAVDVAGSIIPASGYVTRCGDRVVAVVGGGRPYPIISHKRLAVVSPDARPSYLAPRGQAFQSPSCSSDGLYVAAVAMPDGSDGTDGHVTIVSTSGGTVQTLTSGADEGDYKPEWGPHGTGVLFGRSAAGAKRWTLWYAPEGSGPASTGIKTLAYSYDWSATPPTGSP